MRRILGCLVSFAALVATAGLMATHVFGASATLSLPDVAANVDERVSVNFSASDFADPGLGAYTIDVVYDPAVATAVRCSPSPDVTAVCNADYANNVVRFAGATAEGVTGNFSMGSITFECRVRVGQSALTIRPKDVYDATLVNLQPIDPVLVHGSITCGPSGPPPQHLPDSGQGLPMDSKLALSLVGLLGMMSIVAVSRAWPFLRRKIA